MQTSADSSQLSVEELSRFFSVLAHDLKSPIFSIDGFSDLLLADYAGKIDEEGEDFLRRIRSSAQQMKKVVDDMCFIVKLLREPAQSEPIVVQELIEELRLKCNHLFEETGTIFTSSVEVESVRGDHNMLKETLLVLLRNGAFFNDHPAGERTLSLEVLPVAGGTEFRVRDNGIGIDPRYLEQVFELGIKLDKSRGGGPGYGLFLARKLVTLMGGSLTADTAPGEGSTFRFVVP